MAVSNQRREGNDRLYATRYFWRLQEVLDECVDKYLRRVSATYRGKARTGVRGVWLALGTHGYRKPTVVTVEEEGGSWRCGTVPVCAHAGCDGLATLFTEMGIQPVTSIG